MNKADELFEMLQEAYRRGAIWVMENHGNDGLNKAAYDYADYHTSPLTIAERKALSASPAGVVKPLEWVDRGETIEDRYKASSVVGDYYVRRENSGLFSWRFPALRGSVVVGDAEAAKSAAFEDYSARIMSAIEPAGVGVETPPPSSHVALPQDVIHLVIAAREFWDEKNDLSDEAKALDRALEAFSSRVPYENEPESDR